MSRGSNPAKVEQWTACLARFQDSGLTVAKFCEEEGVSAPSFYQWRRRLASAAKAGGAARREGNARREMKSARPLGESRNGAAFQSVNVLPARTDSELSWTVDFVERKQKAAEEAAPFKKQATAKQQEANRWKEDLAELKKAKGRSWYCHTTRPE